MSQRRITLITLGIMLSLFLASMEGSVVSTAMPTIIAQLGGLSIYSWVFTVYLLASTAAIPIYGKLSDLYGRKRVFTISLTLFLLGSVLCGQAHSMEQLIAFRTVQGLGAGGILPLAFTIVGELFDLEQRARMQGLFSGVWGVSAVIGPLIGGFLVDQVGWQWIFYINVLPGLLAGIFIWVAWRDTHRAQTQQVQIDILGALFLTLGVLSLLLGLEEFGTVWGWGLLAAALGLCVALVWAEQRAADPIMPFRLFHDHLFSAAVLQNIFSAWAVFGSLNYIPLFVQAVLGTSATQAGITLMPMSLAWTFASILGGWLLLRVGCRTLVLIGMGLVTAGTFFLSQIGLETSQIWIMVYLAMMGTGMGLAIPAFLIAVQSTARKQDLGIATSLLQFSRNIGNTLGVATLGIFLNMRLSADLQGVGIDPQTVSLDSLITPVTGLDASLKGPLRGALASSIADIFVLALVAGVLAWGVSWFAPRGRIAQLMQSRAESAAPEKL